MGISRLLRDSQGDVESLVLAFHSSVISIALFHEILSPKAGADCHARSLAGIRSGQRMLKRFSAAHQSCTGLVHLFEAFFNARYNSLRAASSVGNEPRILMILRSDMLSDSTVLVVYMTFRISAG